MDNSTLAAGFGRGVASGLGRLMLRAGIGVPVLAVMVAMFAHDKAAALAFAIVTIVAVRSALRADAQVEITKGVKR